MADTEMSLPEKEEYEEAARLRDEIKRIKGENNVNE